MYKVITPAGNLKVNTLTEAMDYKKIYGYPYQKIISVSDPKSEYPNDELDIDVMGNCYSDADPEL